MRARRDIIHSLALCEVAHFHKQRREDFRGKKVPHIKVWVNGELLYEFLDYTNAWSHGHLGFQQHDPGSKVERLVREKGLA